MWDKIVGRLCQTVPKNWRLTSAFAKATERQADAVQTISRGPPNYWTVAKMFRNLSMRIREIFLREFRQLRIASDKTGPARFRTVDGVPAHRAASKSSVCPWCRENAPGVPIHYKTCAPFPTADKSLLPALLPG